MRVRAALSYRHEMKGKRDRDRLASGKSARGVCFAGETWSKQREDKDHRGLPFSCVHKSG